MHLTTIQLGKNIILEIKFDVDMVEFNGKIHPANLVAKVTMLKPIRRDLTKTETECFWPDIERAAAMFLEKEISADEKNQKYKEKIQ